MNISRDKFFKAYRTEFGRLRQEQVQGLEFLLTKIEATDLTLQQASYVLATVKHETADTYQPIKEIGMKKDADGRWYNVVKGKKVYRQYGSWFGRGYVQITWKTNYQKFGKLLELDLVNNPDLALEPETAWKILHIGMTQGLFTGHRLSQYISARGTNYVGARRIVNATDKDDHIARLAESFEDVLKVSAVQVESGAGALEKGESGAFAGAPLAPSSPPAPVITTPVVEVPQAKPEETQPSDLVSKFKARWAALPASATGFVAAFVAWLQGSPMNLILVLGIGAAVIGLTYVVAHMILKNRREAREVELKLQRERQAHEITMMQARTASDPNVNTVRVVPQPITNSDPPPKESDE